MIAEIQPFTLHGEVEAPSSKSLCHRLLIGAALTEGKSTISNVLFSKDIEATIRCLKKLGAAVEAKDDTVMIDGTHFLETIDPILDCGESGSTLRFLIPIALLCDQKITFTGSERLLSRPQDVYESIAEEHHFLFERNKDCINVKGKLEAGTYTVRGNISSQFITGLIFALSRLDSPSRVVILPPIESGSYIRLTLQAMSYFGADIQMRNNEIVICPKQLKTYEGKVEADESNAAFLDAYNLIGSDVKVLGLCENTIQGDAVYHRDYELLKKEKAVLDLADCPDLGPVYMALAALNHGALLNNTHRLKEKESDRGAAMKEELEKAGAEVILEDNRIEVKAHPLKKKDLVFSSHNDHRIVMAMTLVASLTGGKIEGAEAVAKSFPDYFDKISALGAKVRMK